MFTKKAYNIFSAKKSAAKVYNNCKSLRISEMSKQGQKALNKSLSFVVLQFLPRM